MNLPRLSSAAGRVSVLITTLAVVATPYGSAPTYGAPAAKLASCGTTVVASHAAGKNHAPENTVAGIKKAAAMGADMVEMDVRWSKGDGTADYPGWPVLMHDTTTTRTTGTNYTVASTGVTALTALNAANYGPWIGTPPATVPYGYDFFKAAHDTGVIPLLDVKVLPTRVQMDKLIEYADKFAGMRQKLLYMASYDHIKTVRAWYPDLQYGVIEYPPGGRTYTPQAIKAVAKFYAVPYPSYSAILTDYMHAGGVQLFSWTSDTEALDQTANWDRVYAAGVDVLITNEAQDALASC